MRFTEPESTAQIEFRTPGAASPDRETRAAVGAGRSSPSGAVRTASATTGGGPSGTASPGAAAGPVPAWRDRVSRQTLVLLVRHRLVCLGLAVATAGAGALVTLRVPPYYIAHSTIFPAASDNPLGSLGLGSVAGLVGDLGLGSGSSSQFPLYEKVLYSRELLVQLLQTPMGSRTLIDQLGIEMPTPELRLERGLELLRLRFTYETDKKTALVSVGYQDTDPARAAAVVNRAVELLDRFDVSTASGRASERRKFIEARLQEASHSLGEAEQRLERFKAENLRIGNAPALFLEQARLERELGIEQEVYLTLRKEAEMARIQEQQALPVVNVLDRAVAPLVPDGPSLLRNTALAGFLGALLSVGLCAVAAVDPRALLREMGALGRART